MLNSASSWPKAAPVSAALHRSDLVEALVFADDQRLDAARAAVAIVGEVLQHPHRAAVEGHDRHQVGAVICVCDELLRRGQRAQLIGHAAWRVMSKYSTSSRRSR